jgi:predicted LPLAT superfamily acyltransferase
VSANVQAVHWARIGEATFAAGIWFLYGIHAVAGRRMLSLVLWPVVVFYACTQSRARRASLDYLGRMEAAHGVFGVAPSALHWLRHLMAFAETLVDKLLAASGRYRFSGVRLEGREHVDRLLAQGRGGLLVTSHIGCLEVCQALASRMPGLRLTVLVHTRHAERFNAILRRLDADNRIQLMQVTDVTPATAVAFEKLVSSGGFVAIAGDRVPVSGGRTARVRFLGSEADFPVGAYVLASLLGCPLLTLGCVRHGSGHVVHFDLLAERVDLPRAGRQQVLERYASAFAGRLEALLVRSPYEWFNFFPFWSRP